MSGYEVSFNELKKTATEFSVQGEAYANLMRHKLVCPSAGGGGIDKMLNLTLQALYEMHVVLGQAISAHAEKLDYAQRNYKRIDMEVFDLIMSAPKPTY